MDNKQRRRVLTVLLATITSATTLTVVHKCVMVDTIKIHTSSPVRDIARATNGTVIASAMVVLPARDTVIVHDTLLTTRVVTRWIHQRVTEVSGTGWQPWLKSDATRGVLQVPGLSVAGITPGITRTASFRDSTFAGIISGVVTAPPDSGPIGVTYRVTRPAFTPTVAFLQTDGGPLAVVSWQGERVELKNVVFRPEGSRWIRYVEAEYSPVTRRFEIDGTVGGRIWSGLGVVATVRQRVVLGDMPEVGVGVRREF